MQQGDFTSPSLIPERLSKPLLTLKAIQHLRFPIAFSTFGVLGIKAFKCVDYTSSSSSVLEEMLLSLLLDWLCRLACFDLAVTNHLQREKDALASPA